MADGSVPITFPPPTVTCKKEGCGAQISRSAYECPTDDTVQR